MSLFTDLFDSMRRFVATIGGTALFFLRVLAQVPAALLRPGLIVRQIHNAGGMSLVIIMTCGLFVGMVLGLSGYELLERFGSEDALGAGAARALIQQLGPVVAGLLFAGRAGTALASEIGLMSATDQLAAMEMMAVDPVRYVVAPRFLGGVVALPLLTIIFIVIGIFGVHLVGVQQLGVDPGSFWSQMRDSVDLDHIWEGVIKGSAFGAACSLVAVYEGFRAEPTAEGVGRATTRTVVNSAVLILILNYIVTALML